MAVFYRLGAFERSKSSVQVSPQQNTERARWVTWCHAWCKSEHWVRTNFGLFVGGTGPGQNMFQLQKLWIHPMVIYRWLEVLETHRQVHHGFRQIFLTTALETLLIPSPPWSNSPFLQTDLSPYTYFHFIAMIIFLFIVGWLSSNTGTMKKIVSMYALE